MRRLALAVVVGSALFFAGSAALLTWITEPGPPSRPGSAAAPGPDFAPVPAPELALPGAPSPASPPAADLLSPPRPAPARSFKQQVIPADRRHSRTLFRRELAAGLASLQERVAHCGAAGGAAYVLSLESVAGAIRVADVQLASTASASGEASCVVSALHGQTLPAPSAEPGTRWSMPFAVRAGAVATSR